MRKTYPSDITRKQFKNIQILLESARKKTRPRELDLYDVFCGVLYVLKSGCQWRMVPSDLPKWRNIYAYFQIWSEQRKGKKSILEQVLKKNNWRGSYRPWEEKENKFLRHWCTKRKEYRFSRRKRIWCGKENIRDKTPYCSWFPRITSRHLYHHRKYHWQIRCDHSCKNTQRFIIKRSLIPCGWRIYGRSICRANQSLTWSNGTSGKTIRTSYVQSDS